MRSEVNRANKRNVLIPVRIDFVEPPFGFEHIQSANLVEWLANGGGRLPTRLKSSISRKISPILSSLPLRPIFTSQPPPSSSEVTGDYSVGSTSASKAPTGHSSVPAASTTSSPASQTAARTEPPRPEMAVKPANTWAAFVRGFAVGGENHVAPYAAAVIAVLSLAFGGYLISASEQNAVTGRDQGMTLDICPTNYGRFPRGCAAADLRLRCRVG